MVKHATALDDRYTQTDGRVLMSSVQALVRLPLVQKRRDELAGLNTAGFITGYRGSPIGVYDAALWGAKDHLAEHNIEFIPGVNEELAASSIRGTQQLHWFEKPKYDGVFSIWYGKMVGADRAHEALKMGNLEGSAKHGGVLVIAADDHGGKSSATAQGSEQSLVGAMIPVLYPANTSEFIRYGLLGLAMSRFSGLWVGFKCTNDTLEATSSVSVEGEDFDIAEPDNVERGNGLNILEEEIMPLPQEKKLVDLRLPAAIAFAKANRLDHVVIDSKKRKLGIVTAGKAYLDTMQALTDLGLSHEQASKLGMRVYKVGMTWPLEPDGIREFVRSHEEILVVEEKRPVMEPQLMEILYNEADPNLRPAVSGKKTPEGEILIPMTGETSPLLVQDAIISRMEALGLEDEKTLKQIDERRAALKAGTDIPQSQLFRQPYFCSGCPHNTSTAHPEGTVNYGGVGCHALAHFMPDRKTSWVVQMGGEGTPWVGMHRFTDIDHIFQNLGDGTYFHSGSLAIRAAAASGANITYKLLYNDAVAMTGGQPVDGELTVDMMARQIAAEGVKKIVLVTDEPDKYPDDADWPKGLEIRHRRDLLDVHDELAEVKGVTALIYDQTCAAEKRRRRKRGLMDDPDRRAFINTAVCEGCGDCSQQSNCLSVQPVDTVFGRKRVIDQSSCNKDFSCVEGFCPSFVTVSGVTLKKNARSDARETTKALFDSLPSPDLPELSEPRSILVTGIGGTGVLTVGAILAMAAHLEDRGCSVMDMTGMAQKGGSVLSHLKLSASPDDIYAPRIGAASSDVIIGCDLVVATGAEALASVQKGATKIVANTTITPTAQFQQNSDIDFSPETLLENAGSVAGAGNVLGVEATELVTRLLGNSILTNIFMVGFAYQKGLLPLSHAAIEEAIRLNGVSVQSTLEAFEWGRLAAHDIDRVHLYLDENSDADSVSEPQSLDELVDYYSRHLADYQNKAYAGRFRETVRKVRDAESALGSETEFLTATAARVLAKVMAYKDEYEVARLHRSDEFRKQLRDAFDGVPKLKFHMAPPVIAKRDARTGHLVKREFGSWIMPVFGLLARMKFLRGTAFDVFGKTGERRMERNLVKEVENAIEVITENLTDENVQAATRWLAAYEDIKGYGHVKEENFRVVKGRLPSLREAFASPSGAHNPEARG